MYGKQWYLEGIAGFLLLDVVPCFLWLAPALGDGAVFCGETEVSAADSDSDQETALPVRRKLVFIRLVSVNELVVQDKIAHATCPGYRT